MEIVVPDLGDFSDVEIIEVLVKPGDVVDREQGLITLETEKATMDVPTPAAGRVRELKVAVGDRVSAGDVVAVLDADGAAAGAGAGSEPPSTDAAEHTTTPAPGDTATVADASNAASQQDQDDDSTVLQPRPTRVRNETVLVPDLGDFADVEIIEVLVAPGDRVTAEQGLVTLETEKASMDVPSPGAGEIVELRIKVGDRVSAGDALLVLKRDVIDGDGAADAPASASAPSASGSAAAPSTAAGSAAAEASRAPQRAAAPRASAVSAAPVSFADAHASPSVRKLARELGVDLGRVRGTGRKNRVTADDVKAYVKEIMLSGAAGGIAWPEVPRIDFAKFGAVERKPLSRIQKISGPRLHASWVNIPHVFQHDEADITELEARRNALKPEAEERGVKLTPLAFIVRAVTLALAEMPVFKSSLEASGEEIVLKHYTHIGFAADTPNGLVVPVIRDADRKDIFELAKSLGELSAKAREGKLRADDIQGAVFTISSLGGIGGRFFTPIINAPEVAILGVSRHQWQPIYREGGFVPRLMLPLSLSYDHRVIDGAAAVRFTTRLGEILGDVDRLLEAVP